MDDQTRLAATQALHQQGRHDEALALLEPLAGRHRSNLQLQMFCAKVARSAGNFDIALRALGEARKLAPADPQVANIEANTLSDAGRGQDALRAFERLLKAHPGFVEGHINRAITALGSDSALALELAEQSLALHPGNARLWSIKGAAAKNLGRPEEAVAAFDRALAIDPKRALTWFNRGVAHRALERHGDAWSDYQQAAALGAAGPQFDAARAAVLLELDEVEAAERLYESAHAGGDSEAGPALARLRREYRGDVDPFSHYERAIAQQPGQEAPWRALLGNLLDYREYARLRDAGDRARQQFPGSSEIAGFAAMGKAWSGERETGIAQLEGLAAQQPGNGPIKVALAELHLLDRQPDRAEHFAREALRLDPFDQSGWAFLSTAWRLQGDEREFWLCDYDRLVMVSKLVNAAAAESAGDYATHLAEVLEALHVTRSAPGNQSLRQGTQTPGSLFNRPDPRLAAMRDAVLAAASRAIAALPDDPAHPFLSRKAAMLAVKGSWSVRLAGQGGGHHVSHFHGEGWISSAYYARLPASMAGQGAGDAGCIHFGAPPAHLGLDLPPRRVVRPEPGLMALFPSYMWHGTVPFDGDDVRLTAAFDLVPAGRPQGKAAITIPPR